MNVDIASLGDLVADPEPRLLRGPPPLVIGSPVAQAIYRTFAGYRQSEILLADPDERIAAAVAVAAHLVDRTQWRVTVVAERTRVRNSIETLLGVTEPESDLNRFVPVEKLTGPTRRLWVQQFPFDKPNAINIIVHDHESLVVTSAVYRRSRAVFVIPSTAIFTSHPDPDLAADIPFDIVVAGSPT